MKQSNLIKNIGCESDGLDLEKPYVSEEAKLFVNRIFKKKNINSDDKIILVNINSSDLSLERRWPLENFIELIDKIAEKKEFAIFCIGSKSERRYVKICYNKIKNRDKVFNIAGELNIEELFTLLLRSKLLITNDSGPLHFAVALEIPTISFFGPETPILYGPIGQNHKVFFKDIYCSPCLRVFNNKTSKCKIHSKCLREIKVEEVYKSFEKLFLH